MSTLRASRRSICFHDQNPESARTEAGASVPAASRLPRAPAFEFGPLPESVGEDGSDTFALAPGAVPSGSVTVAVSSGDAEVASVLPASLTFTTVNWAAAQSVTVTGAADNHRWSSPGVPHPRRFVRCAQRNSARHMARSRRTSRPARTSGDYM